MAGQLGGSGLHGLSSDLLGALPSGAGGHAPAAGGAQATATAADVEMNPATNPAYRQELQHATGNLMNRVMQAVMPIITAHAGVPNFRKPSPSISNISNNDPLSVFSKATPPLKIDTAFVKACRGGMGSVQSLKTRVMSVLLFEKRKGGDYPMTVLNHVLDSESYFHLESELSVYNQARFSLKARAVALQAEAASQSVSGIAEPICWTSLDPDMIDIPADSGSPNQGLNTYEVALVTRYGHFITSEVRPLSVTALDELHEGEVRQGKDEATARYAQRFMAKARVLLNTESQPSLCRLYLAGLKSGLQEMCLLTKENERWQDLNALIQFSYGEEERFNLRSKLTKSRFTSAGTRMHQGDFTEGGLRAGQGWKGTAPNHIAKRQRSSGGTAAVAMNTDDAEDDAGFTPVLKKHQPAQVAAVAGSGGGGTSGNGSGGRGPGVWTPPIKPYKKELDFKPYPPDCGAMAGITRMPIVQNGLFLAPITDCPVFIPAGQKIPKMNQYIEDMLALYGLCNACRRDRHTKNNCTNQLGAGQGNKSAGGRHG